MADALAACRHLAGQVGNDLRAFRSQGRTASPSRLARFSRVGASVFQRQHAVRSAFRIVHPPVLVEEILQGLALKTGAVVLDATVGLGGHAEAILDSLGLSGRLIGLDRDPEALVCARERLKRFGERVQLIHAHFGELAQRLAEFGVYTWDAALFDCGVSALQLKTPPRGFSFLLEGPLDMRMDPSEPLTAQEILQHSSEKDLMHLLRSF